VEEHELRLNLVGASKCA